MAVKDLPPEILKYVDAIRASGLTIYDKIQVGDPKLWVPTPALEALLHAGLSGVDLQGLPLRTRSKLVKQHVCEVLGYPTPPSFQKTNPRFPGQDFDTYTQQNNNLQVWNEALSPTRRYVMIRPDAKCVIVRVKVVNGDSLAKLDTTGTLTQKYQARCEPGQSPTELAATGDTAALAPLVQHAIHLDPRTSPADDPEDGRLISITSIHKVLGSLIGESFADSGSSRDRNRGEQLHRLVCNALGYSKYQDNGQHPDVRHQLLEVKLQTSPTIDLGLVEPASTEPLDVPQIGGFVIRHCDVRYAVFCGSTDGARVTLTHLIVTTGEAFFRRFPRFGGKVLNKKLQIPLPRNFFD